MRHHQGRPRGDPGSSRLKTSSEGQPSIALASIAGFHPFHLTMVLISSLLAPVALVGCSSGWTRSLQSHQYQADLSRGLAIPLVSLVGRKRLTGFLIRAPGEGVGAQRRPLDYGCGNRQRQTSIQREATIDRKSTEQGSLSASDRATVALKSDEKCSMTGPMTVCDSVDGYPTELILRKLTVAKNALRSSNFNLDSLFSDERDHSNDPFDDPPGRQLNTSKPNHETNIDRMPSPHLLSQAKPEAEHHPSSYRSGEAEFVDLVERRAIRLDSGRAYLRRARRQIDSNQPASGASVRVSSGTPFSGPEFGQPDVELVAALGQSPVEPICRARSIYITPRAAWKYVVNAPEQVPQVRQIIRVDICEDPFGPCSSQVSVPLGFVSQCKQKYSKKKLLAFDSLTGMLEVDTFFVPSCCVCQLMRVVEPDEPASSLADENDPSS